MRRMIRLVSAVVLSLGLIASFERAINKPMAVQAGAVVNKHDVNWPVYGGQNENDHYSPLTQINRDNVKQLQIAWTYDTEEQAGLQTHPLMVYMSDSSSSAI